MNSIIVPAIVVLVVVAVIFFAAGKNSGKSAAPISQVPLNREQAQAEITSLLANSRKIEAIKIYRSVYAVGLKEAKDAVEAIDAQMKSGMNPAFGNVGSPMISTLPNSSMDPNVDQMQIRMLLDKNQKIQAIKIYREQHNCDLVTAKNVVETIERDMRLGR